MAINLALLEALFTGEQIYFQLVRFAVVVVLGIILTRLAVLPLVKNVLLRRGRDVRTTSSIENIVIIISLFTTFTVALQAANFGNLVTVLGTIAAAATVAIGFGMRDQVSSVVSGIFILTDNPFVKGDYIKIAETQGVVKQVKLRATTIETPKSAKKVVPNNKLTSEVLENYTKGTKTQATLQTRAPLDNLDKSIEKLLNLAKNHEKILNKPKPELKNIELEEKNAIFEISYWVNKPTQVKESKTQLNQKYAPHYAEETNKKELNENKEGK